MPLKIGLCVFIESKSYENTFLLTYLGYLHFSWLLKFYNSSQKKLPISHHIFYLTDER